jgi:16S rRNA (uracil1498-N3)-methyltransferase
MKKIHHFIIQNIAFSIGILDIQEKEFIRQLRSVLKIVVGEHIIIGDGKNNQAEAVILEVAKKYVRVEVGSIKQNQNELPVKIQLYCALLKRENFEWVVQKATELGVSDIVPLITSRTIKSGYNKMRLQKIAGEAAEQCERGIIPVIHEVIKFSDVWNIISKKDTVIMFDKTGARIPSHFSLKKMEETTLLIGPEGGWTDEELQQAKKNGAKIMSLGKTMLRAETAVVVGCFWISQLV